MCTIGAVTDRPDAAQTDRAFIAAHLYYVQERTMEAIALELATSRSTVSRLLAHARAAGIVEIQVRSPLEAPRQLAARLSRRFGVAAHVIPSPADAAEGERLDRVAVAAAHVLSELVRPDQTIGVAWGSTLAAVSRHLTPHPITGTRFVQLNGSGNTRTTGLLYASEILSRFAMAFGGTVEQFPVPAFFDDPLTREAMWRERSTRRILDAQAAMDLVVFSVGSADPDVGSHVYTGGYLDASDLDELRAQDVVGDVATVFYRLDGSTDGISLNDRASGPDVATLRRVPRRCCIVAGPAKLASLRGALAAGVVTDLVLDEGTARMLDRRRTA